MTIPSTPLLCRVMMGDHGLEYESATAKGYTISQVIEDDNQYGTMKPANGKYFTWAVLNEDEEMTVKEVENAVQMAQKRWRIYGNTPKFKRVTKDFQGVIDFRIEFRTVESDPDKQLNSSTVMYHYYPINKIDHPLRGLCVVNKAFFFTIHGNPVTGAFMASKGIPVQFPDGHYESLDFDTTYGHELGHGLGLPHDEEVGNMMSFRVDLMSEFPSERDQARIIAKYGERNLSARWRLRWLKWLKRASDR
jgi:hypothetical protein